MVGRIGNSGGPNWSSGGGGLPDGSGDFYEALEAGRVPPIVGTFSVVISAKEMQFLTEDEQGYASRGEVRSSDLQMLRKFISVLNKAESVLSTPVRERLRREALEKLIELRAGEAKVGERSAPANTPLVGIQYNSQTERVQLLLKSF